MEFVAAPADNGLRLDQFLAAKLTLQFSRSQIKRLIEAGQIEVAGAPAFSAHQRVRAGQTVRVESYVRRGEETRAEAIPIEIVYEDPELLVVNKPAGMVVHPAHGNPSHTLVNALLYHIQSLSRAGGPLRPGIVHRLDKDTSGLLVVAKSDSVHAALADQFRDHRIDRTYEAFVRGVVQHEEGEIDEPVGRAFLNRKRVVVRPAGGKSAVTYYRVRRRFPRASWLEIRPRTGRTHQIRVHLAHLGYPLLGDSLYGIQSPGIDRQALHASKLGFVHPRTREKLVFEAPLPADLRSLVSFLEKN
ncbi:MAG: RluA family pseudouridine synthase [Candidatus Omnitrophica bacterium]|nr:RluA family pseudouridine synthase [Candidatus Omnitrophota bacterium]